MKDIFLKFIVKYNLKFIIKIVIILSDNKLNLFEDVTVILLFENAINNDNKKLAKLIINYKTSTYLNYTDALISQSIRNDNIKIIENIEELYSDYIITKGTYYFIFNYDCSNVLRYLINENKIDLVMIKNYLEFNFCNYNYFKCLKLLMTEFNLNFNNTKNTFLKEYVKQIKNEIRISKLNKLK